MTEVANSKLRHFVTVTNVSHWVWLVPDLFLFLFGFRIGTALRVDPNRNYSIIHIPFSSSLARGSHFANFRIIWRYLSWIRMETLALCRTWHLQRTPEFVTGIFLVYCVDSKLVSLEYPEDGPQTDLHLVSRTNCLVTLQGLLGGTSWTWYPETGGSERFVTPLPRIIGGINIHRGFRFVHGLSVSLDLSKGPSAQIHHCVIPFFTHLTRAASPRFQITKILISWLFDPLS